MIDFSIDLTAKSCSSSDSEIDTRLSVFAKSCISNDSSTGLSTLFAVVAVNPTDSDNDTNASLPAVAESVMPTDSDNALPIDFVTETESGPVTAAFCSSCVCSTPTSVYVLGSPWL